jgi:hypothetical protein
LDQHPLTVRFDGASLYKRWIERVRRGWKRIFLGRLDARVGYRVDLKCAGYTCDNVCGADKLGDKRRRQF